MKALIIETKKPLVFNKKYRINPNKPRAYYFEYLVINHKNYTKDFIKRSKKINSILNEDGDGYVFKYNDDIFKDYAIDSCLILFEFNDSVFMFYPSLNYTRKVEINSINGENLTECIVNEDFNSSFKISIDLFCQNELTNKDFVDFFNNN